MEQRGLTPRPGTCHALLSSLEEGGQWAALLHVWEACLAKGVEPEPRSAALVARARLHLPAA